MVKVSVSVSESNDSWKVIIEDTGIGIPSSEQSKLFKLHFRASNAINSKVTGSGIGLMLVGKLVRLHGGKINVESIEHQGTTVRIVFPKSNKHFQNAGLIPPAKPLEQTPETDGSQYFCHTGEYRRNNKLTTYSNCRRQ